MTYEENTAWVYGGVAVVAYGVYLSLVLGLAQSGPLPEVAYIAPLLWTIGSSIVATIVATIVIGAVTPRGRDQRDRDIYRFGEYVGNSFVVLGAIGALVLALLSVNPFWIANVIYLGFTLSAIVATVAKLVAYRRGLPRW